MNGLINLVARHRLEFSAAVCGLCLTAPDRALGRD